MQEIYITISKALKIAKKPVFAVFDFDNTCIFGDIGEAVFYHISKKEDIDLHSNLTATGKTKEADELTSRILSGLSLQEIGSLVKKVLNSSREIKPRPKTIELIDFLKNNGVDVWIVSASAELVVRQAMKHFNIEANLIGVHNKVVNGRLTAELDSPESMIEGKVECIKKFIDEKRRPLVGVGDSINDLPMLEYSQIKVVVNRQNALTEKARKEGWFLF